MIYRAKRKILKVAPAKRFHAMNFIKCKNADLPKAFEIGIFTNSIVPSFLQVHIYFYAPMRAIQHNVCGIILLKVLF